MAWGGLSEGGEVDLEDVGLDDLDMFLRGEALAESGGEFAIEFDGDEARGARGEQLGDGGFAGTDFDDSAPGEIAERVGDATAGRGMDEEVLAEFGFAAGWDWNPPEKGIAEIRLARRGASWLLGGERWVDALGRLVLNENRKWVEDEAWLRGCGRLWWRLRVVRR